MKAIHFFLLIVTLPALFALSHDFYLFYVAQGEQLNTDLATKIFTEERPGRSFDFAALGFIWTEYYPESYALMKESFEPEEWANIQLFLKLKAFYVCAAFAVVMYVLTGIIMIFKKLGEGAKKVKKSQKAKMR